MDRKELTLSKLGLSVDTANILSRLTDYCDYMSVFLKKNIKSCINFSNGDMGTFLKYIHHQQG